MLKRWGEGLLLKVACRNRVRRLRSVHCGPEVVLRWEAAGGYKHGRE